METILTTEKWLLNEPAIPYHKEVIYLKGNAPREAYINYLRMRWGRKMECESEWVSFYNSHPTAYHKLVQNQHGPFYIVLFK